MIAPVMGIFAKPHYQSEVTQFLQQLKAQDPQLEARQREGRALLWDKNIDRSEQQAQREARVPQKAYVYGTAS
jgi:hypothetical protein